jgi:hypothetical protein
MTEYEQTHFFFFFLDLKINKKPRGLPTPYSCGFFFFFFFGVRDPFFFSRAVRSFGLTVRQQGGR